MIFDVDLDQVTIDLSVQLQKQVALEIQNAMIAFEKVQLQNKGFEGD